MQQFKELVKQVLACGEVKECRNGITTSLIGTQLKFDAANIPLLNGRKIFYKGVVGEFSAFMNDCCVIEEFKERGCNYWDSWANDKGILYLDYVDQLHTPNVIVNGQPITQLKALKHNLKTDKFSRRHIINLWRPENLHNLSLPCCHYSYQFIVDVQDRLNMIWTQRSADVMVGIPSDMILAYLWVQCLCKELGFKPGEVTMNFGDTHIYEEHIIGAKEYIERLEPRLIPIAYVSDEFTTIEEFKPNQLIVSQYDPHPAIKLELKV